MPMQCLGRPSPQLEQAKVAIVGMGHVGSTTAYALMLEKLVAELALIDIDKDKAEGEARDLEHGMQFTRSVKICAGDSFELVHGAHVIIIAAGVAQEVGQTRSDLLEKNAAIFSRIVPEIVKNNKDAILLVITNPLDVLTYLAWKLSNFDSCRVFGTGTVLDTARLRHLIGQHIDVSAKDITAYMLAEHGDTEFAWWSRANVAGVPLQNFTNFTSDVRTTILNQVRQAAYDIIRLKGATYYAIGLAATKVVRAILTNQSRVFTVSSVLNEYQGMSDLCLSVPTVVRGNGVCEHLPIELDSQEQDLLAASANKIKDEIAKIMNG